MKILLMTSALLLAGFAAPTFADTVHRKLANADTPSGACHWSPEIPHGTVPLKQGKLDPSGTRFCVGWVECRNTLSETAVCAAELCGEPELCKNAPENIEASRAPISSEDLD